MTFLLWISAAPLASTPILIMCYWGLVCFLLPTMYFHWCIGWAMFQSFQSYPESILIGGTISFIGMVSGGMLAFLLSRYLLKSCIDTFVKRDHPKLLALDRAVHHEGYKVAILMPYSGFPYSYYCYLLGISKIRKRQAFVGMLGLWPSFYLHAYIGCMIQDITSNEDPTQKVVKGPIKILLPIGILLVIILLVYIL